MKVIEATSIYADYLAGLPFARANFDDEGLAEYEADLEKAKADMETAWLESNPVREARSDLRGT